MRNDRKEHQWGRTFRIRGCPSGILSAMVSVLLSWNSLAIGAEDRRWDAEVKDFLMRSKELLIQRHLCSDANDCVKKQLVFANSERWGMYVDVYGISDAHVLSDLTGILSGLYFGTSGRMAIKAHIHSVSKAEDARAVFFGSGQIMKINFEGENNAIR